MVYKFRITSAYDNNIAFILYYIMVIKAMEIISYNLNIQRFYSMSTNEKSTATQIWLLKHFVLRISV